jgi:replicative DNA helicase
MTAADTDAVQSPTESNARPGRLHELSPRLGTCWDFLHTETEGRPLWGLASAPLWVAGEPLYVVGDPGVGKSTLAQQLALSMLREDERGVLNVPTGSARSVLYIAADRPDQVRRSIERMVSDEDRAVLDSERFLVHRGPLPFDLSSGNSYLGLHEWLRDTTAHIVVFDSLKDVALDLSAEETGQRATRAFQLLLADGIEILVLHHPRKASQARSTRRIALSDVYGSAWFTASAGSVVALEIGSRGRSELRHLKSPSDPAGPWSIELDTSTGTFRRFVPIDPIQVVIKSGYEGATAEEVAELQMGSPDNVERKDLERIRRILKKAVNQLVEIDPGRDDAGHPERHRWYGLEFVPSPSHA